MCILWINKPGSAPLAGHTQRCLRFLPVIFLALAWLPSSPALAQTTDFTLGTSNLLVGPSSGTNSIVLAATPANTTWTATNNAPWLHLTEANQTGAGSTNVVFSFETNPGPTRSGTLTIGDQALTITQAGSTYIAAGGLTTLVSWGVPNSPQGVAVDAAGNVYLAETLSNTILKWSVAYNTVTTLASGLDMPQGLAVDGAGDVYFADSGSETVKMWSAASSNVTTVFGPEGDPCDVALDSVGNIYAAAAGTDEILQWTAANGQVTALTRTGLAPVGLKLDVAGNVYIANFNGNSIQKWIAASQKLTTLVSSGLSFPDGLAVDGAGNVYIADASDSTILKWTASSASLSTLLNAPSVFEPGAVGVDAEGNVFIANSGTNELLELPYAFVDPTPKLESLSAGTDALPPVLPTNENLLPPFAPTSDQSWLTITGITNGVVSFSFTANTGPARTANITLLGQTIPITQGTIGTPPILTAVQMLGSGVLQFNCTNNQSAFLTVLSSTNLAVPLRNWTVVGTATNVAPGQFQFASLPTTNAPQLFYVVRSS